MVAGQKGSTSACFSLRLWPLQTFGVELLLGPIKSYQAKGPTVSVMEILLCARTTILPPQIPSVAEHVCLRSCKKQADEPKVFLLKTRRTAV